MEKNKNLKLKLGLCGLTLTSFLALNTHSIVHADTLQGNNTDDNGITWDSGSDDSQVVKEEPQQEKVSAQSHVQTSQSQPVQNKKVMVSSVSSTSVSQQRVETSNRCQSNSQANIEVSNVQDVAQAPVQKQKVAQFNQGSKIYSLNNSSTLSKNNGDGYVITNAGKYNGRVVDIGVTINNVSEQQGDYTTKWSNGDKADVTGKTDASFKYQNSVLAGTQQNAITLPNKTQSRIEKQTVTEKWRGYWDIYYPDFDGASGPEYDMNHALISDKLINKYMQINGCATSQQALIKLAPTITTTQHHAFSDLFKGTDRKFKINDDMDFLMGNHYKNGSDGILITDMYVLDFPGKFGNIRASAYHIALDPTKEKNDFLFVPDEGQQVNIAVANKAGNIDIDTASGQMLLYGYDLNKDSEIYIKSGYADKSSPVSIDKDVKVTDQLQLDQVNNGSLNYDYTVGVYDSQTGDLITDLKPEYKSKAGKSATNQDTVMNNAIKAKIQAIKANKASVAYTGTVANDDVAFYKETRAVNPQDQALHKSATRIISINLPDDPAVKDRYKGILNSNNQIVQTINFTRTGVENVVNGQVTYGAWTGPSSFGAVTLPDIPGYTMTMN